MTRDDLIEAVATGMCESESEMFADAFREQWPLIVDVVAEWLEALPLDAPMAAQISDRWREEMGA